MFGISYLCIFSSTREYTYKCSSVNSTIELLFDNTDVSFHPFYIIETTLSKNGYLKWLTRSDSDKCRTYKSPFGQMQNRQKAIRTNYNSPIRTNDNSTIRTSAAFS